MVDLRKRAIHGLGWSGLRLFSVQLTSFIVQLVLARMLLPEVFGLIAMLQIFISIGQTLMDNGMSSSLIRTTNPDNQDYSTVFFINVAAGIIIYGVIFVSANYIANFYRQPQLERVLQVFALSIIIQSLVSVQLAKFTKELNFRSQLILELPSLVVSSIIAVFLAYKGYGVWSLVWLHLSKSILFVLQTWLFVNWRPSLNFNYAKFKAHFKFGYKLTLSSLLNTIYDNINNIIIGKFFSATQLGYYDRAHSMRQLPIITVSSALNKVTYPVFAAVQDDDRKLKSAYSLLMKQIIFWVAPFLVLLSVISEPLFSFLLTDRWLPAVPYFQVLCFASILYPVHAYNLNIVTVKGRSDLFLKLEFLKKIVITITVLCALPFGVYGLVYAQLLNSVIGFFINSYFSGKLINYPSVEQIKDIAPIIIFALLAGLFVKVVYEAYITPVFQSSLACIAIVSTLFGCFYFAMAILFRLPAYRDFKKFIFKR